jgi:ClpP class serine protease
MVPEFADEIFAARRQKPIVALADTMIASAAYWLAAQTKTIYASASSQIGSIGVYFEHDDLSGMFEQMGVDVTLISYGDHKVDGNPYEPLSDGARATMQADVNRVGDTFTNAVARGRGVTKRIVLSTFGQGQVFDGETASARGLADNAGTAAATIARLQAGTPASSRISATVAAGTMSAAAIDEQTILAALTK